MMLMGTFITAGFPPNVKPQMGYFQFPIIDANVPTAEDGPVESLHIPSKAKNKADAHAFLAFVETPEIGAQLATGSARCRRTASRRNRKIRSRRSASRFWRTRRAASRSSTIAT